MAIKGANLLMWSSTYTDPAAPEFSERNIRRALEMLTLTGLANFIYAVNANTLEIHAAVVPDSTLGAFNGAPNPGPGTDNWNRAMECAMRVNGGSRGAESTAPGTWGTPRWGAPFNMIRWVIQEISAAA